MIRLMMIVAYATLAVFLGVLVYSVPRIDLGGVVLIVLLLAAYDFFVAPTSSGSS